MKLKHNRKGLFLSGLGIIIFFIYLSISTATPNIHRSRETARMKGCFSNQRVIDGAVSMYNLDNEIPIVTALPGDAYADVEEILIEKGYLKDNIHLYEPDCSYGFIDINASGTVFCKRHGSCNLYDNGKITMPSYDVSLEKPLSQKNLDKRNKRVREREIRDFQNNISARICNILFSPIIGFLLAVAFIIADILKTKKRENIAE